MRRSPLLPVLLLLAACAPAPAPPEQAVPSAPGGAQPSTVGTPDTDVERPAREMARDATTAGAGAPRDEAGSPARSDGYGALRFGMAEAAMRAAWNGPALRGLGEGGDCHYLSPEGQAAPAVLAFMLEGGRFVRYDVGEGNTGVTAPGGGRIGLDVAAVRALYPGAQVLPHKYVPEGSVLRVPLAGDAVLVFETGADGLVGAWRVGLPPQVDYVEGCS